MEPAQSESSEKEAVALMEPDAIETLKDSGTPDKAEAVMKSAASESLVNSEQLESSSVVENAVVENNDDTVTDVNNGGTEQEHEFKEADVHDTLEVIAATGKFWHEWDILKRMLSCHLKKVLSEYPEAKTTIEQQTTSLGETIPVLLKRLDYALDNFIEGPPFTLQRLCEVII
ncbi:hypothetical protein LIER_15045 [Lithospermum erythrorhizon]|uniref:Uncharacterized protein n=1 Tax=Lithospermum erythrorhizon TaxID=34254 RepID=A0AAV3Q5F9_LITER